MITYEWARTADDVLWRRTKCGLHLNIQQKQLLMEHLRDEAQTFARCAVHANFAEGVTAFTEKRAPKFDNK